MLRSALAAILALVTLDAQAAGDPEAGKAKSAACSICHGSDGKAQIPMYPRLAGQNLQYLTYALKAYRSGARRHEVMAVMARPLSDQDIADLAAWYASIKVEVSPP